MSHRKKQAVFVIVVVLGSTAGYFMFMNPYGHTFSITMIKNPNEYFFFFSLGNLHDTNVTIVFVNESSLFFRMRVELYAPNLMQDAFELKFDSQPQMVYLNAKVRIKNIDVELGNSLPTKFFVGGINVNASITYSNGVPLSNVEKMGFGSLYYEATGTLWLTVLEDVNPSKGGLEGHIQNTDDLHLYIDLRDDMQGFLSMNDYYRYYAMRIDGWYLRFDNGITTDYSTDLEPLPLERVELYTCSVSRIYLWLYD